MMITAEMTEDAEALVPEGTEVRHSDVIAELRAVARDPARHAEMDGLLRMADRALLPVLAAGRHEEIEAFAKPLRFAVGLVQSASERTEDGIDRCYLIGRLDTLL